MKRHRLTARLLSPLVVRRERQSQRSEGLEHLPGTLVRGALAQLYIEQHGRPAGDDERFRRLFLDDRRCRFGPLDPAEHVFPLTAASCKRRGGFQGGAESGHGVCDLLWLRVARRLLGQELPETLQQRGMHCAACGQDLKPQTGFWYRGEGGHREARKRWQRGAALHVGINRCSHSAHEQILYSLPVMEPRAARDTASAEPTLVGLLEAGDDEAALLRELLRADGGEVRIGHARTRGHGRILLSVEELPAEPTTDPEAWSRAMIDFLRAVPGLDWLDPAKHFLFSLGLPTGALLVDAVLRYTLDPSGMVAWLPPLPPPQANRSVLVHEGKPFAGGRLFCLGAVARHERLRGWNAAHNLPRQDEWTVARGAVYAYLFEGDADGRRALGTRLGELRRDGLGGRRGEGLGRVSVSDDFHRAFHPREEKP